MSGVHWLVASNVYRIPICLAVHLFVVPDFMIASVLKCSFAELSLCLFVVYANIRWCVCPFSPYDICIFIWLVVPFYIWLGFLYNLLTQLLNIVGSFVSIVIVRQMLFAPIISICDNKFTIRSCICDNHLFVHTLVLFF